MRKNEQQPIIKYPMLLLWVAAVITYLPTVFYQLTRLDDVVFIYKFKNYNSHLANLATSFHRGVFTPTGDYFYRPLFLDAMLLNYQLFGQNIMSYHIINVLLHSLAVVLLYRLLRKLNIDALPAFIVTLLFTVHPVLVQAVAWIPGRNETLLAVFILGFLINAINYSQSARIKYLVQSTTLLLLAVFTKETGVLAVPAALILVVWMCGLNWRSKTLLLQYITWGACLSLWYGMRLSAQIVTLPGNPIIIIKTLLARLPVLVQYLGKIFIPTGLSVFPLQNDTSMFPGILASIGLFFILAATLKSGNKKGLAGLAIFLLFSLPGLFAPQYMGMQAFEHRLYLPMIGILIVLASSTILNNKLTNKQLIICTLTITIALAALNFRHQRNFKNPYVFWTQAVATAPSSGFAHMMLALQEPDRSRSSALFQKALQLNPRVPQINFNIGIKLQAEDSVLASEKYFLAEKVKSGFYECDFYLAKVALAKGDFSGAATYLKTFMARDENNKPEDINKILNDPAWQQQATTDSLVAKILKYNIYNYASKLNSE